MDVFEIQFTTLNEFLAMGDYAFNVWSVYALFTVFFAVNIYYPLLRRKQILKELKRRQVLHAEAEKKQQQSTGEDSLNTPIGENL